MNKIVMIPLKPFQRKERAARTGPICNLNVANSASESNNIEFKRKQH